MKEFLTKKIEDNYREYIDLATIIKEKTESLETKRLKIKDNENTDLQEKVNFFKEASVDLVLFTTDQKIKFDRIFFLISLYNELGYEGLSEEIVVFYKTYRMYAPIEIFIVKDGNLIEKEDGSLEKARESFEKNNEFMKQLLNSGN